MDPKLLFLLMQQSAIQNPDMEFLRQLIAESRQPIPQEDADKLRMLQGSGMGLDGLTTLKGDE
tara:strand:+ start:169 stop:357 length:189 start_codon:yes stop_codon:yes gene_type:complete